MQIGSMDTDNTSVKVPKELFSYRKKNNNDGEYGISVSNVEKGTKLTSLQFLFEFKGTVILILTTVMTKHNSRKLFLLSL